uniref:Uncharacterized protein n=1 Tax=Caenorhabditis japonica TaxID=281687 RepID=A0A8R1IM49_CAEJA
MVNTFAVGASDGAVSGVEPCGQKTVYARYKALQIRSNRTVNSNAHAFGRVQPQIRSARIRSGTNPHCARIRNRPNTKCPNRKCYESELVLIVTARINNARISNGTNPKWYESETPDSEVVRIRSDTK